MNPDDNDITTILKELADHIIEIDAMNAAEQLLKYKFQHSRPGQVVFLSRLMSCCRPHQAKRVSYLLEEFTSADLTGLLLARLRAEERDMYVRVFRD